MGEVDRQLMGQRIRELRKRRGMTQRELAEASGIGESALRSFELGARYPKEVYLRSIARALRVRPEAFEVCGIETDAQLVHLLFNLEGRFGIHPKLNGEPAIVAEGRARVLRKALHDWGRERRKLESGEIDESEYENWKDTYHPFIQLDPFGDEVADPYTGKQLEGVERKDAPSSIRMFEEMEGESDHSTSDGS